MEARLCQGKGVLCGVPKSELSVLVSSAWLRPAGIGLRRMRRGWCAVAGVSFDSGTAQGGVMTLRLFPHPERLCCGGGCIQL